MGPVVEKAQKLLRGMKKGSIVVPDTIVDEMNKQNLKCIEQVTTSKCGEMNESARTASVHQVIVDSISERDSSTLNSPKDGNFLAL